MSSSIEGSVSQVREGWGCMLKHAVVLPNGYNVSGFDKLLTWFLLLQIAQKYGTRALLAQLYIIVFEESPAV